LVRELAAQVRLDPEDREELALAVNEAGANAIQHSGSPEWYMAWTAWDRCLEVEVQDKGRFEQTAPSTAALPRTGRGFSLIGALVDRLEVRKGTSRVPGTVVKLRKCG
jgi:anti-sigma regulatory factor (Ser/Thr protein kinase)